MQSWRGCFLTKKLKGFKKNEIAAKILVSKFVVPTEVTGLLINQGKMKATAVAKSKVIERQIQTSFTPESSIGLPRDVMELLHNPAYLDLMCVRDKDEEGIIILSVPEKVVR